MSDHCLQYVPFSSSLSTAFWDSFTKLKLNELCLNTDPVKVHGYYSRRIIEGLPPLLELQNDAFNREFKVTYGDVGCPGTLINTNTIEEYKSKDKVELLRVVAEEIWEAINTGDAERNPSVLSSFLVFVFADLKKYQYYYWLAYPVFAYPTHILCTKVTLLCDRIKEEKVIDSLCGAVKESSSSLDYFVVQIFATDVRILPLSLYYETKIGSDECTEVMLGFSDPCNLSTHPGWPLRNLMSLAAVRWPSIKRHAVLALREKVTQGIISISPSLVFDIEIPGDSESVTEMPQCLGWEKNERGKMGPRFISLRGSMEPTSLAESAVELNLKLMRWRLVPDLNLEVIRNCRCLLLGAGTLGCNVARCLLGWGVRTITLIDCGTVSFSNPVRQSLYSFQNCLQDGQPKAEAAAKALKEIHPRINARGITMTVPMPGHPVGPSLQDQIKRDIQKLEELVEIHDALFLLTDSREGRWLLTLLGAAKQKIVITAALGFDSFLVVRHGIPSSGESDESKRGGCYFCNDVVAPGNSMSDRTLDQQCTVTRPGMSFMAAGHAVEMLAGIMQHPLRGFAPVMCENASNEGLLGLVPHSIRYYLSRLHQLSTATVAFKDCVACSKKVLNEYSEKGFDFFLKVFNSSHYLEEISGLATLQQQTEAVELSDFSGSEQED